MRTGFHMEHRNPQTHGIAATPLARRGRSKVDRSAQRCMVAMVDYLAASGATTQPLNRIGDLAQLVLKRSEALNAARNFIATCEADN